MHRILPAPALRAHVQAYCFVVDLDGRHGLAPVVTAPHTAAVLALNLGRPSRSPFAVGAPVAGLVGLQSQARSYLPQAGTFLVMAMLSPLGLARLFPHSGEAADAMIPLEALWGAGGLGALLRSIEAAWTPEAIARHLDAYLWRRLDAARTHEDARVAQAWATLLATGRVDASAEAAGWSVRHWERWCARHLGHSPKALVLIDRLQRSLRATQQGGADPAEGYSDQAHQIRAWRRGLGLTPGAYRRQAPSAMAQAFAGGELAHFM